MSSRATGFKSARRLSSRGEANPGYAWTPLKEVHATPAEIQRTKRKALARKMRSAVRAVNAAIKGNGPLTFKDFIRPVDHVRQLARSLGASPVLTVGEEQQQSGPHLLDNANATLVSCCGSFVQLMSEYGYVPLAAPVLDFSTLTIIPAAARVSQINHCWTVPFIISGIDCKHRVVFIRHYIYMAL